MTRDEARQRFGALVAVRGATFSVRAGQTFCIMGLSGCGKSTLLRCINNLVKPDGGKIDLEGIALSSLGKTELREVRNRRIGMVFQGYGLFPHLTVVENVAFGLEMRGMEKQKRLAAALDKLEIVGLAERAASYPDELSGGMKQRVGLARALASDTDILLMDEPFSALDPLIRRELQSEFAAVTKSLGKTTIFITHDFEEAARVGDQLAIMRDGDFVQVGAPSEIINRPANEFVERFVRMATERMQVA